MSTVAVPPGESTAAPVSGSAGGFGHRIALDGIRGLAVAVVLVFHGGFTWAQGGYLGVSLFFTLSGFLITSLALYEFTSTGRIAIGAFWVRRLKRLVPALVVTVGLVVVAVALVGDQNARRALLADSLWGLGYGQNWHWVLSGQSYGDVFASPSPLLHLWSLAVEEQFYIVFPLLAALALRRGRWMLGAVAAGAVVASIALPVWGSWSADRVYYGTDARAGEIAIGVLAAVALFSVPATPTRAFRRAVAVLSTVALGAFVAACVFVPQSWFGWSRGGFVGFALVSVLVVVAAAFNIGPVARLGRTRPLRRLGKVSYGLYLYHWPVLWVLGQVTAWSGSVRFVVGVAFSYAMAEASLYLLETPARTGRWPWIRSERAPADVPRRVWTARIPAIFAASAVGCLILGGASWVHASTPPALDFEAAQDQLSDRVAAMAAGREGHTSIAVFGDSTALMTGIGIANALDAAEWGTRFSMVAGGAWLGCGVLETSEHRGADGTVYPASEACHGAPERWAAQVAKSRPDVAVLETGRWESWGMRVPGHAGWHVLGEPVFDEWARDQLADVIAALGSQGATVVYLTAPSQLTSEAGGPDVTDAKLFQLTELVRDAGVRAGVPVEIIDLAGWHAGQGDRDRVLRPDGVHVSEKTGVLVAEEFLLPELARVSAMR